MAVGDGWPFGLTKEGRAANALYEDRSAGRYSGDDRHRRRHDCVGPPFAAIRQGPPCCRDVAVVGCCLDVYADRQPEQLVSLVTGHGILRRAFRAALPRPAGGGLVWSHSLRVQRFILPRLGLQPLSRRARATIAVAVLRLRSHRHCLAGYSGVRRFSGLVPPKKTS